MTQDQIIGLVVGSFSFGILFGITLMTIIQTKERADAMIEECLVRVRADRHVP